MKEVEKVVKDSLGNETKEYGYKFNVKPNTEIAKNLKGHLMLVTGDMDKNVNPAHTYRMAQALIEAGKDFDMLVIPVPAMDMVLLISILRRRCTVSLPSICWVILVQTIGEILTVTNKTIDKIL